MRVLAVTALALVFSACDRLVPEEPPPVDEPGTFEATVRQVGGGGFEVLSGTAVFAPTDTGTFVVRLASPLPSGTDVATLDLVVVPGTTPLNNDTQAAICYRSPVFADGPYRTETGDLVVSVADAATVEGVFTGTAALDLPTGPDTSVRLRVTVEGAFRALPGAPGVDADTVRRCTL